MNTSNSHTRQHVLRQRQDGLTLVEMMIAMLIGLFLTLGSITVYMQSKRQFNVSDSMARLQENVRFALDVIEPDVRLANFWGLNDTSGPINVPGGIAVFCDTNGADVSAATIGNTAAANVILQAEISIVDDVYGPPGITCPANTVAAANSDVLLLRHASATAVPGTPGNIQVVSNFTRGQLFNTGVMPGGFAVVPPAFPPQIHNVVISAYYVDQQSDLDPNTPSLRMKTLGPLGVWQDQELVSGVENLQVQFGVDVDADGDVERYVDADNALVNPLAAPGQIVAVRLWILARAPIPELGFTDPGPYVTPDADFPVINTGGAAFPAANRRVQMTKTVFLRNNRI